MKITEKSPNGLYESMIKRDKRKTLEEVVDGLFHGKRIFPYLDWKWPINHYFFVSHDEYIVESEELDDIRAADKIYSEFRAYVLNHMSKEERDIMHLYKPFGDMASFPYDVDEKRRTSVPKEFTISTEFGKLNFKFAERSHYNVPEDYMLAYDDEENEILMFVKQESYIRTEDVMELLRDKYKFIHELTHFMDNIKGISVPYTSRNDVEYLNEPNEIRANTRMLIYVFGAYLFKNKDKLKNYNLKKEKDVKYLFEEVFLKDNRNNIVNQQDLEMMRKEVYYMNAKNKKRFFDTLCRYIVDEYGTDEDINYKESHSKENMIRLLRLEEKVINEI